MTAELTKEELGRQGFVLYQNRTGFRFGTDSVLLAWFTMSLIPRKGPVRILELGSGCGGAAICLAARLEEQKADYRMDLVEIDPISCEILQKNIEENKLGSKVTAYCADIRQMPDTIRNTQYDIVFANPPYFTEGSGEASSDARRNSARQGAEDTLDVFAQAAASRLIPSTGIYAVVIDSAFSGKMTGSFQDAGINVSRLMPVFPNHRKDARIVLMAGRRRDNEETKILPALYLDDKDRMHEIYEEEHKDCFI
ncbi:MAG: methyltransferase domain-containing protein [Clostridiales bacterium]|nr:methyltransferase domain-containing protein [Clostridiales bacterium]